MNHRRTSAVRAAVVVSLLALAAVAGCAPGPSWHEPGWTPPAQSYDAAAPFYARATLAGAMGSVRPASAAGARASLSGASRFSRYVRIDLEQRDERWWMMTGVTFPWALDEAHLRVGAEYDSAVDPANRVDVLGCSGAFRNVLGWDHTAERTVVRVEQGPRENTRVVRFYASFGAHYVEGVFEAQL